MANRIIEDEASVVSLLTQGGLTDLQAASKCGVSKNTISRIRDRHGIKPKPKRPVGYYDLTPEEEVTLRELYGLGKNDYEVAAIVKRGRNTLRAWREKNGISSQSKKKGLTKEDASKMYELYTDGKTTEEIAKVYGVGRTSASRHLAKNGYKVIDRRINYIKD